MQTGFREVDNVLSADREGKVAIVLIKIGEEQTGIHESPECSADRKKVITRSSTSWA